MTQMREKVEIAFRRKVRAIWLERGMELAAQEVPWKEAKSVLASEVAAENPGLETIRKVLEHVRRIWFEPPGDSLDLRSAGLKHFRTDDSPARRFVLTWGMTIAAYPFVGSVAEAVGRLLKLQHEVNRADIQRRLREQFGDRDFVNRITRYNVSSFLDWDVIAESKSRGLYLAGNRTRIKNDEQLAWLVEAVLISRGRSQMAFSQLCSDPALFPILFDPFDASSLRKNSRLRVARESLNEEMVFLETATSG